MTLMTVVAGVVVASVVFFANPRVWSQIRENLSSGESLELRMKLAGTRVRIFLHHLEQHSFVFRCPSFNWWRIVRHHPTQHRHAA